MLRMPSLLLIHTSWILNPDGTWGTSSSGARGGARLCVWGQPDLQGQNPSG